MEHSACLYLHLLLLLCASMVSTKAISKTSEQKADNSILHDMLRTIVRDSKFRAMPYHLQHRVIQDYIKIADVYRSKYTGKN